MPKKATLVYSPQQRIWFLMIGAAALFMLIAVRLVDLQVIRHGYYEAAAENQRKRAAELRPHRGAIYMTESEGEDLFPVATNHSVTIAYAVPRDMPDPHSVASELAPALYAFRQRQAARNQQTFEATGQNLIATPTPEVTFTPSAVEGPEPTNDEQAVNELRDQLTTKFDQRTDPYEPILRPYEILDSEFQAFLAEKKFPGIVMEEDERRIYPENSLAAHLLGYVGFNAEARVGRYGIEGFFNKALEGDLGWFSGERDTRGSIIGVSQTEFKPAEDGADIYLTVDRVVQSFIEQALAEGVRRYGAERGSIIVTNPKTGAILGMATYPTFDPNTYYAVKDARVQTNPVVSDIFEPGSILKPVIMASAIESGLVKPSTTFVDSGAVKVDKYTIDTYDSQHHGVQTMTQVLEKSNNVGMVWVGQQLGAEKMYDYLRRFGLGERTGVELEGETQTNLPEPEKWNIATVATASFGQGVAVTSLQAINAINTIANQGNLTQPHIVRAIKYSDDRTEEAKGLNVRRVISAQTAAQVSAMMVSVIENGVGVAARVPGYYLAGKTGTAQVPDERGKYSPDRKIISFVGFGPVGDPRFSIMIKLDNPAGLSLASGTAAPMFRTIADKLLTYYQIPPSYDVKTTRPKFVVTE